MLQTLLILLVAHLTADFLLQTEWIVRRKGNPLVLILHVAIVTLVTALLLGSFPPGMLSILFASHLLLDAAKIRLQANRLRGFLVDQTLHAAVIALLAFLFPDLAVNGFWHAALPQEMYRLYLRGLTVFGGFVLCVPAGGVMIGIATAPFLEEIRTAGQQRRAAGEGTWDADEIDDGIGGLQRGGRYIGWLERALIMLLLFMGQASSIGFLFAAKSILRYGEIKNAQQRRIAEYIIIGTLLSFGWGLLTGFLTQQTLALW